MDVAKFALRHDKALLFATLVLAALGVRAYTLTPQSIFPNMSFSRVEVVADAGQLPPDQVRTAIALPLEQAMQTLPAVLRVRATSSQGSADLIIDFQPDTEPRADLDFVNQSLSQVRSSLPAGVDAFAVIINPNNEPIVSYALTSSVLSPAVLRELTQSTIQPALAGVPGLGRILVAGGPMREFHVMLDPSALAARGISPRDVALALTDANEVQAVGIAERFYQRSVVVVDSSLRDARSIARVIVPDRNGGSVPVGALGTVELGIAPQTGATSYLGRPSVVINAYALAGADTVAMAHELDRRIAQISARLPGGTSLSRFWDQTTLITDSQNSLRDAILLGALLAVIVIFLFLRNIRMTLVAAIVIPIAMAIAILALKIAGETLNLMSVGGLAVAVGLIIDDAIVVIENIARNLRERADLSRSAVVRVSMSQISAAMMASTATTVVVFLPLALLTGVSGFFFRALAFTLASSLIVSLFLALFVTPTLAAMLLGSAADVTERRSFVDDLLHRYEPLLRWSLSNRMMVYRGAGVVLVATVALLLMLPSDFLPRLDEGQFEVDYTMPVGTTLAESDAAAHTMENIIAGDAAVATEGRLTGIDSNGFSPTPQNQGMVRVSLKPRSQRESFEKVSERLRQNLAAAVPAAHFDFKQVVEDIINDVSGAPAPVEVSIVGNDQQTLVALADQLAAKLEDVPGVVDTFNGVTYNDATLRIAPHGARLAALGLTASDVATDLSAGGQGTVATKLPGQFSLVPVRIAIAGKTLNTDPLVFSVGGTSSLSNVAQVRPGPPSTNINEENGTRLVRVTANFSGRSLSAVFVDIKQAIAQLSLPPGYLLRIGGQYESQRSSFAEFTGVVIVAVLLVFGVMLATFGSFRLPLVILTAIPLALIGVALGLFVTGTPFNVSSFMGLLLLVGIVVKNGILLIDVANKRQREGDSVENALVAAGRTRLRPIVMTTLAAIGGLLPLALGIGSGAEMERPLAIAVIGGLSTATAFTLVLIPVLYATFIGNEQLDAERGAA
jgi:CzcA family heavy metal efflux pump